MKQFNEETRTINSHLDYLKNQVLEAEKRLFKKDISISSKNLKNELFGNNERQRMFISIFQNYNNKIEELVGKEYAPEMVKKKILFFFLFFLDPKIEK